VVAETDELDEVRQMANEIKQTVSAEILVDNRKFFLTSSIGVCAGKCHENFEQAVKNADTAMFISKKTKNTVTFYTSSFNHTKTREMIIEEDIRSAADNRELILHYQPIIDLRTGKTAQAEALLRWKHPELGLIPPGDFIALAENTKMIIPITDWIIEEICDQINRWRSAGLSPFAVGINLSAVYIENCGDQLPEKISEILRRKNLEQSAIHFEITESSVIQNIDTVRSVFTELHRRGIHLALDDFGTGYSSLGYVKDLPLSILKLDRMFIQMIDQDEKQQTIVRNCARVGHAGGCGGSRNAAASQNAEKFSLRLYSGLLLQQTDRITYIRKLSALGRCNTEASSAILRLPLRMKLGSGSAWFCNISSFVCSPQL